MQLVDDFGKICRRRINGARPAPGRQVAIRSTSFDSGSFADSASRSYCDSDRSGNAGTVRSEEKTIERLGIVDDSQRELLRE